MTNPAADYASPFLHSVDGAITWQNSNGVRIIYKEAHEDDDTLIDLHLNVTSEGIVIDLVGQVDGEILKTACLMIEDFIAMAK